MNFEFATATRIIFGPDASQKIGQLASELGSRAFVLTGSNTERAEPLLKLLDSHNIEHAELSVTGEPTTDLVEEGVAKARDFDSDMVISIGGGSVLDTGKAIAAMVTNAGELMDYLEVVGLGRKLAHRAAPHIAVPTTAGTGAEVTRNAVLAVPEHKVKVSMRSPLMLPTIALVDPVLTYSMPPEVTASTGLDALTQLIEAFVSNKANPLTDGICCEGLTCAARSLQIAYEEPDNHAAREDMALASLFGGLALANAKLGAVHGFAGPLGGMFSAPHGSICAALLPHVMKANVRALAERAPNSEILTRYKEVARILTGYPDAAAADGVAAIADLCTALSVPPLSRFGLKETNLPVAVDKARKSSSMKGNPIELTEDELTEIIKASL
jgi:alcohol dehydrogenase class IV